MTSQALKEKINKLPDSPGVYKFLRGKEILYIGKATSLKDRVRSYMSKTVFDTRGPLIEKMLGQFDDISFQKTDSVLEALILEAYLIKKHQPYANTMEKDDRSFNFVVITKEDFPRVLIMRGRELEKTKEDHPSPTPPLGGGARGGVVQISKTFGPFPNGSQLKEALKIVRKLFPYRDKCEPLQKRPCFNRQIGLCPGVCTGEINQKEYAKTIKNIVLFFEGNKKQVAKNLNKEMKLYAKNREFEKAGKIKKQLFALNHIQDVSLIKSQVSKSDFDTKNFRIESYDIAHLSGTNMVGAMVVVESGELKKSDYRKFKIKNNKGADDTKALEEVLTRRLAHKEWPLPNLIVVDGGVAQKKVMEEVLKQNKMNIPVVSVVKDERHKAREIFGLSRVARLKGDAKWEKQILLANAEAHRFAISFHKQLRGKFLKK